jgi:hypothetical protein
MRTEVREVDGVDGVRAPVVVDRITVPQGLPLAKQPGLGDRVTVTCVVTGVVQAGGTGVQLTAESVTV